MVNAFQPADILLPKEVDMRRWAVIACDQFTSDPAYWARVRKQVGDAPSTLHMILPEAELGTGQQPSAEEISGVMNRYLGQGIFQTYPRSYIYVERTLQNGRIRPGLIGAVDLEQYDYRPDSGSVIRATEKTIMERIPPRTRVRKNAALEFPHVLMLCDDSERTLIEPVQAIRDRLPKLYDFDLMEGGGHIAGWLLQGEDASAFDRRMAAYTKSVEKKYAGLSSAGVLLAVGDGNHSLAAAKSCYETLKAENPGKNFSNHPARFALVELENIHDPSLEFEPIHRILTGVDGNLLLRELGTVCAPGGYPVQWIMGKDLGTIFLDRSKGELAAAVLQNFLDAWLDTHAGKLDYIHGRGELTTLAERENAVGFLLPPMEKSQLFRGVIAGGVLPRKTFSMGHAQEKRYYLEGRKIQ